MVRIRLAEISDSFAALAAPFCRVWAKWTNDMRDNVGCTSIEVPRWVQDAVFYQIFPDRFARGKKGDVERPKRLLEWNATPTERGYFGGDLWGVVEHLDHLVDLGITAIYLNPIFQSACNHRYHTHDYERVDPLLGGDVAFRLLMKEAHQRGLRVILDGVFNHASRGFWRFNDVLENGSESPWVDWFHIEDWPLVPYDPHDSKLPANYVGWFGHRELPKLNTDNAQVREFIMRIAEHWTRHYKIDGWRLDVPNEITTAGFWEEFRERVLKINPDAYLVGELWCDATDWLRGDRFHASMNYLFAAATIAFTAGQRVSPTLIQNRSYHPFPPIDAHEFKQKIENLLRLHDCSVTNAQFNLLDSHDTPRLLSLARGDKATIRLATLFQMTYPGTPCIYYGDEIGLRGTDAYDQPHRDADARWPFPWGELDRWDQDMLAFFRKAIALRREYPVLRHGTYVTLYAKGYTYAFARHDSQVALIVVINAAEQEAADLSLSVDHISLKGSVVEPIFGEGSVRRVSPDCLKVSVPPRTSVVFAGRN